MVSVALGRPVKGAPMHSPPLGGIRPRAHFSPGKRTQKKIEIKLRFKVGSCACCIKVRTSRAALRQTSGRSRSKKRHCFGGDDTLASPVSLPLAASALKLLNSFCSRLRQLMACWTGSARYLDADPICHLARPCKRSPSVETGVN